MIIKKSNKINSTYSIKMSKKDWFDIGKKAGWIKKSQHDIKRIQDINEIANRGTVYLDGNNGLSAIIDGEGNALVEVKIFDETKQDYINKMRFARTGEETEAEESAYNWALENINV